MTTTAPHPDAQALLRKGIEDLERSAEDAQTFAATHAGLTRILQAFGDPGAAEKLMLDALRDAQMPGLNPGALDQLRRQLSPEPSPSVEDATTTLQGLPLEDLRMEQFMPDA